jgi:clan AA aspartic protease
METTTMGKVMVTAKVENMADLVLANAGHLKQEGMRSIEITDALVDTGASTLSLPRRLVAQLGLSPVRKRQARTSAGPVTLQMFSIVRLTIQGRDCSCDVVEIADDCPPLIGQIALEMLDFVVDPMGQRLIGNPAHGGEHIIELY